MDYKLVPATLQAARLAQGLSLSALGKEVGISAATLSRIENGSRAATDNEVESLVDYLRIPATALCRPLVSERLGLSGFYHRKLNRAGARAVSAIENQCLLNVVAIRELIEMIDLECPQTVLTIDLDDAKGGPEEAANMIRLAWQIPRGPIQDLFAVVERAGCLVIHSDFGIPEMDALYQKVRGVPPIFWVNSRKPLDRVRWSLAHELGHLVLHEEAPIDSAAAEAQANSFASAVLMPRSEFRSECPTRLGIPELVEMKRRWRCSMQAIVRRAHDVGRITSHQYKSLNIEMSKNGWKKREPYPIAGETPRLLARAIGVCLRDLKLTEEELADRLACPVERVKGWRQPFPGQRAMPDEEPRLRLSSWE